MARLSNVGCSLRIKNHGKPNFAAATPRTPDGKPDLLGIWEFRGGGHGGAGGRGVGLPSASPCCLRDAKLKNGSIADPRFPDPKLRVCFETQFHISPNSLRYALPRTKLAFPSKILSPSIRVAVVRT